VICQRKRGGLQAGCSLASPTTTFAPSFFPSCYFSTHPNTHPSLWKMCMVCVLCASHWWYREEQEKNHVLGVWWWGEVVAKLTDSDPYTITCLHLVKCNQLIGRKDKIRKINIANYYNSFLSFYNLINYGGRTHSCFSQHDYFPQNVLNWLESVEKILEYISVPGFICLNCPWTQQFPGCNDMARGSKTHIFWWLKPTPPSVSVHLFKETSLDKFLTNYTQ
jgi:hypothetical protein